MQFGLGAFFSDRRGNVAMMWGLMGVVLLGLVGITVDLTRAEMLRARMQNAVDGAALVAERSANLTLAQRQTAAHAYFDAEMGELSQGVTFTMTQIPNVGHRVEARMPMAMSLASLVSDQPWNIRVASQAQQGGRNIEVAMVLDTTGSMGGQPIIDLRNAATDMVNILVTGSQTPFYSKVALVPYSMSVNVGSTYATAVRGSIPAARNITGAAWANGSSRNITGITRANPAVVTSNGHGLTTGSIVWITGVSGMTQVNNRAFTVGTVTTNTFQLQGVNSSSYSNYSSGGNFTRCLVANCNVVVTSNGHGFANNDYVFISGVSGMTQINNAANTAWQLTGVTANTFTLLNTGGSTYSTYTSGGSAYCTVAGCEYFRFTNAAGSTRVYRITTCVDERTGVNAYTDAAPSTTLLGRNYQSSTSNCASAQIMPLTSDRTALLSRISTLSASGTTAGHTGAAWGWYMLAPNFSYLWPAANQPGGYNDPNVLKIVVLMTDGEFNTAYCNGVLSRDSTAGTNSERINCDAPNGSSSSQAVNVCNGMKNRGIIVYTVGFNLGADQAARDVLTQCASSPSYFYEATNGADLRSAFQRIADRIGELRLTQ